MVYQVEHDTSVEESVAYQKACELCCRRI